MKVAIIGAGSMGHAHAVGWKNTDADIVGVLSSNPEKSKLLAQKLGASVYKSYDELLSNVDIVDICIPTHLHKDYVLQAAKAGCHILCEKPIALNVADGLEMISACEKANVRLFIGMVLHFFPEYVSMKQAIDSGAIGEPQVVRLTRASYRPQKTADNWFMDEKKSGGMITDLMIHDLEMSRWLTKGEVIRVFAKSIRSQSPDVLADHCLAILRYDNGTMAHIEGSWGLPAPMFNVSAEVAGDNGLIEWESDKTRPILQYMHQKDDDTSDVALPTSPLSEDPWEAEVKHFYEAVINDTDFRVSPLDALRGLQIALAVKQSAMRGHPVNLTAVEVVS
ncbi:MAG: Gfo/Idh/MocA family oxidoreductase [Phototrophicaceae bacterium]